MDSGLRRNDQLPLIRSNTSDDVLLWQRLQRAVALECALDESVNIVYALILHDLIQRIL